MSYCSTFLGLIGEPLIAARRLLAVAVAVGQPIVNRSWRVSLPLLECLTNLAL